jgi:hypothetical protein
MFKIFKKYYGIFMLKNQLHVQASLGIYLKIG